MGQNNIELSNCWTEADNVNINDTGLGNKIEAVKTKIDQARLDLWK